MFNLNFTICQKYNLIINFAYRTFAWNNEAKNKAAVFCVIVGFSRIDRKHKVIFDENNHPINTRHISPYLISGNNIIVERTSHALEKQAPKMIAPNNPVNYNNLKLTQSEKDEMILKCPEAKTWIKKLVGAQELVKGIKRYCLWLVGISSKELRKMKPVMERVEKCKKARIEHGTPESLRLAKTPDYFSRANKSSKLSGYTSGFF